MRTNFLTEWSQFGYSHLNLLVLRADMEANGASKLEVREIDQLARQMSVMSSHTLDDVLAGVISWRDRHQATWQQVIDHMQANLAINRLPSHPGNGTEECSSED